MRAREPDTTGTVNRDGVHLHYEVHGTGEETVLLLPAWAIVHSREWKAQIPYLAQHYRVVTYDPRGNGKSDRPTDPDAYHTLTQVDDALAVLDAVGVDRVVLVGLSYGSVLAYLLSALHPERVAGAVFIGMIISVAGRDDYPLAQALLRFDEDLGVDDGWSRYNRHSMKRDYQGFVEFFIGECMSDPHSHKLFEDGVGWGLETTPGVLAATMADAAGVPAAVTGEWFRSVAAGISCPTLVIHGTDDRIGPVQAGRDLAELIDAPLVELPGAGHCPQFRYPVHINRLIRRFVDDRVRVSSARGDHTTADRANGDSPPRSRHTGSGVPRVLYLSSPIGLGHARRDFSIVQNLREAVPEVHVEWLAQSPVTRVLHAAGESIHPASRLLANESSHIESECGDHDLHVFQALRNMDEILVANFMTFLDVIETEHYDLVIGDEAWDVDHFLHEDPSAKHARFAWLTDFVGYLPMASGGAYEQVLTADLNAEMIEHVERRPGVRDTAIFVGDPDDVVPDPFGPGLPGIREWTEAHYAFSGYVTGFDPCALDDRAELREELGYDPDETVVVAAVGGSGVGAPLLRRIIEAHRYATEALPNLRTVVVTGPRLDPESLPDAPGVDKRAYVPDLHRHLAACDLAVVQGGLTTTMELTATRRPFLYFPLRNHFEQQVHVRHRLERHRAGRAMDYAATTPTDIAAAMVSQINRPVDYLSVDGGGAQRAASMLVDLL